MSTPLKSTREHGLDTRPQLGRGPSDLFAHGPHGHSPRPRTAIPWGVAFMVILIVMIECLVTRCRLDLTDPVSLNWRFSAQTVRAKSVGCDLLVLGDSLVKHGLLPNVIEHDTSRRTVNLSAARAPTLLSYLLLRRALDAGARPHAIIINTKPAILMADLQFNARYFEEIVTARECLEISGLTRNHPFLLSMIVGRLIPSLRSRLEIQSNVLAAVRGERDRIGAINRVLWRNWTVNQGANVAATVSPNQGTVRPDVEQRLHPRQFHVDPSNVEGMERLMRLAQAHGIPVFWLLPPLSPALQSLRDQSGSETRYEQFVRSFMARYPRQLTVLDVRRAGFPASFFIDETHLNHAGAIALSRAVAKAVPTILGRSQPASSSDWVALTIPASQPAESDIAIEDIEESKQILNLSTAASVSSR
jgi:hypothetical protein